MFELLYQAFPNFDSQKLEKKAVFHLLFGTNARYEEQKLYDQMSALVRLFDRFLAQQRFEHSPIAHSKFLLHELSIRQIPDHFARSFKRIHRQWNQHSQLDTQHYLELYMLEARWDSFSGKTENRRLKQGLTNTVKHLEYFFLGERLRLACEMANRQRILNQSYERGLEGPIIQFLEGDGQEYLGIPVIDIYFHIYNMLMNLEESDTHFYLLLNSLEKNSAMFSQQEGYAMYTYAQNYCIKQINQGQSQFLAELFKIYQYLLEKELLINSSTGFLAHEHYKNITTVALRLKKFEWARSFLDDFKSRLSPEYVENAYNYNLSVYLYENQKYGEVLKLLQRVVFSDVYYHLSAKFLLMRIYYEQEDYDGFVYLTQAFLVMLRRNQEISTYQAQAYKNLIRYSKKAFTLKRRKKKLLQVEFEERVQKLTAEIQAEKGISNANWLLSQIHQLTYP
ncbi:MAG: hypothetical protein AAF587_11920 [Bacteroidota bacterium]